MGDNQCPLYTGQRINVQNSDHLKKMVLKRRNKMAKKYLKNICIFFVREVKDQDSILLQSEWQRKTK